jgi:fluoride ion exporter CrcB/FEX
MTAMIVTITLTLAAGALGAVVRATLVARGPRRGTAVANLTGTLLLALVVVAHADGTLGDTAAVALGAGFAGSLTTFSGWVALLADRSAPHRIRNVLVDGLLPVLAAVGLTVLVFAVVA